MNQSYTASDIEVLSGLEPVRRRPGMYTHTSRPNHLAHEVVDNSVDEAIAGYCKQIDVTLFKDGSLQVADDGRGMPVDIHPEGESERRRAHPHPPARRRQVLRQDLQVLRRSARRRRLRGQCALEESGVLDQARRQGIQHQLQGRQSPLQARSGGHRRPAQHRHHRALLARSQVLRLRQVLRPAAQAHSEGQGRALPRPAHHASPTRPPARRTSGSTPAISAPTSSRSWPTTSACRTSRSSASARRRAMR